MDADWLRAFEPGIAALGWTLVDFIWQGALVAAGYALVRRTLRAPRARLLAGHATLLLIATLPLATLLSHLQSGDASRQAVSAEVVAFALQATHASVDAAATAPPAWLAWLVGGWALGVLLLSLRLWRDWRRLQRLCRDAEPLDVAWQLRFAALRKRLNVRLGVRLLQGARVATPMLVGVLRPTILLPASLVARMPVDQLELILVHELAHLRRLDPLFNLLQTVLDTLLFYHPAVHWISRRVREDRELCCDEIVVASGGDRFRYARALLDLAERHARVVAAPALAANGGALLERIERIVEAPVAARSHTQVIALLGLIGVLALVWWVPSRDAGEEPSRAPPEPLAVDAMTSPLSLAGPALQLVIGDIAQRLSPPALPLARVRDNAPSLGPMSDAAAPSAAATRVAPAAVATSAPLDLDTDIGANAMPAPAPARVAAAGPVPDPVEAISIETVPAPPLPQVRVAPSYPRQARLRGVEGWVVLSYRLDRNGRVATVDVLDSQPAGTFDTAARRALERWRYTPGAARDATLSQRFDFVLPKSASGAGRREAERCLQRTGSRVCHPLHETLPGSSLSPD